MVTNKKMSDDVKKNTPSEALVNKRDIVELTDAFLSLMDELEEEKKTIIEERNKRTSPVRNILQNLATSYNAEEEINNSDEVFDEEEISKQFDNQNTEVTSPLHDLFDDDKQEPLSEDLEKRIFYASLFLSGKPIELATFRKMLNPLNIENRLFTYAEEFNKLKIGVRIRMVSGGYQLVTDSCVTGYLEKYFGERTEALSRAALETVAIIAYRQPVTKMEVEEMREVNSSGTMRSLLEKNLIKVAGRKQVPGKPLLYATTKYFLEYFGLNDISELPTFREWQELKQNL